MDLQFSKEDEEFRAEARTWLRAHVPAQRLPSLETESGFAAHRAWEQQLQADRWAVVSWPEEYGGRGASLLQWLIFEEEYYAAGAPGRVTQNGINLLAPTLFEHGTTEQRARVLPHMARGTVIWAQAWSEPGAGSDLAALRSTARRTEGGWLLDGSKTWSSRAAFADRAFGLFRSTPVEESGARHRGLTYLMFPLHTAGVTVRPIGRLDGKPAFAEIFLDSVFVPDRDVIGEPGQGWRAAMSTAGNERGLTLRSPGRFLAAADRLMALWRRAGDPADTAMAERVADVVIRARAYQLFAFAAASRISEGRTMGAESSLNKIYWSELDIALHETALDLLGPDGELADTGTSSGPGHGSDHGSDHGSVGDDWAEGYVFSLAGPIYGGTNEIQRDIVAERLLGLPKGRRG